MDQELLIASLEDIIDAAKSDPTFPLIAELKSLADAIHADAQEAQA